MRQIAGLAALLLLVPVAGQAACTVSASGVAFGVYPPFVGTPRDFTGTVTLTCTANAGGGAYTVKLSTGGGTYAARRMRTAGVDLTYQLYTNAAHTLIWGDGTGGSTFVTGADNRPRIGGTTIFNVFGRIPTGQGVRPNNYTDTITATVAY